MGCAMGTPSTVFGVALIDRDKANRMLVGLYGAGRAVQYIIACVVPALTSRNN